jgi:hypothetical protein
MATGEYFNDFYKTEEVVLHMAIYYMGESAWM